MSYPPAPQQPVQQTLKSLISGLQLSGIVILTSTPGGSEEARHFFVVLMSKFAISVAVGPSKISYIANCVFIGIYLSVTQRIEKH